MIRDIIASEEYIGMKRYKHHVKGSVYDHSIKVAYLCYKHHKRFGTKVEMREFLRGALLHDYYLYDWHDKEHMLPLTPIPPRTKAGWLICFYDKVAAVGDYCGKNKWKGRAGASMEQGRKQGRTSGIRAC